MRRVFCNIWPLIIVVGRHHCAVFFAPGHGPDLKLANGSNTYINSIALLLKVSSSRPHTKDMTQTLKEGTGGINNSQYKRIMLVRAGHKYNIHPRGCNDALKGIEVPRNCHIVSNSQFKVFHDLCYKDFLYEGFMSLYNKLREMHAKVVVLNDYGFSRLYK